LDVSSKGRAPASSGIPAAQRSPTRQAGFVLAIVCPGQGSQSPGFLTPWLELPGVRERLAGLGEVIGVDLLAHGTTSDADTIRDTAVAQPLIVAAGIVAAAALGALTGTDDGRSGTDDSGSGADDEAPVVPGVVAGHSVGEFTAAVLAGVLTAEQALTLVGVRGRAMAEASAVTPTGMSAVLGSDPQQVAAALAEHGLTAANANGSGQVVAAGTLEQLAALAAAPPARARIIPLQVAGAFHTRHMAPAVEALAAAAAHVTPADPRVTLLSNADGAPVADGAQALARLIDQVRNPVRWDACSATLAALGVTTLVELCPGGALAGLAKRGLPGVRALALKTPDDLDAARALVADLAGATA
jgi:[acyl-carrier-protein] S-malonyltransferase